MVKAINAQGVRRLLPQGASTTSRTSSPIYGAKGLAWVKVSADGGWQSPIAKFLTTPRRRAARARRMDAAGRRPASVFVADQPGDRQRRPRRTCASSCGQQSSNLIDAGSSNFLWVVGLPAARVRRRRRSATYAMHHPFTVARGRRTCRSRHGPAQGARPGLRPRPERHGDRRRQHPDPPHRGPAEAEVLESCVPVTRLTLAIRN
ncbi:MAG: hypothetical protein MZV70_69025 [Desulfobacterales bacterium]|nr:hypothetical protein [Desulfobacterales bacterium]